MRFHELFEYHRKNSAKKWKTALAKISPNTDPEEILKKIEKGDPTDDKTYMQWIISQLRENPVLINDMGHIHDLLKSYEYYKLRLPKEHKRIDQLNYQRVFDIIDKIDNPEVDFENTKEIDLNITGVNQNEYNVIYDGPLGRLVVLKTKNASCGFGRGTKWCIAATSSNNAFNVYAKQGKLYYWRDNTGKYVFHFENVEFKDIQDIDIDWDILKDWRNNHSVLKHLFKEGEKRLGLNEDNIPRAIKYITHLMDGERNINLEKILLKHFTNFDPVLEYITTIIRERWPELEEILLNNYGNYDIHIVSNYMKEVIKGSWPELEKRILTKYDSIYDTIVIATDYASEIIGGKWLTLEKLILKATEELLKNGNYKKK